MPHVSENCDSLSFLLLHFVIVTFGISILSPNHLSTERPEHDSSVSNILNTHYATKSDDIMILNYKWY
jgi:hypothetical protein